MMNHISCHWYDNEQHIIRLYYGDGWAHQDVFHLFNLTYEMATAVSHPVDLLVEFKSQYVPANIVSMTGILRPKISENMRHIYFIDANPFIQALVRSTATAVPVLEQVTFCRTRIGALELIHQRQRGMGRVI